MVEAPSPGGWRSARAFLVSVGSLVSARVFLALSQILVLPILARQLPIEAFAVMAMAMSVVVFCSVLSDAGLGRSLIRTPDYDEDEWSSVFWLLVGVGAGLSAIVLAMAPLWARFYDEPAVVPVMGALAIVPLLQSLAAASNAEVERRENYAGIARVQVATTVVSLAAAVGLALAGAGVFALVAQQVALAGVRLVGILWLSEFRPRFVFRPRLLRGHLIFARDALSVSFISAVQAQSTVIAVGKLLGTAPVGILSMSERFSRLPKFGLAGPMSAVVYVRMAKAQTDPGKLVGIYLASVRLLSTILLPGLALMAVSGEAIFTVMLSERWAAVAPIFALSAPGITIEAVTIPCLACMLRAIARTDLQVRLTVEGAILQVMLVAGAAFVGLEAVAASLTVWAMIYVPRCWIVAGRVVPLKLAVCLRTLAGPSAAAAAAAATHVVLRATLAPGEVVEIGMAIALSLVAIGAVCLTDRRALSDALGAFKR